MELIRVRLLRPVSINTKMFLYPDRHLGILSLVVPLVIGRIPVMKGSLVLLFPSDSIHFHNYSLFGHYPFTNFCLEQCFGDWTLRQSSDKMPPQLGPVNTGSSCFQTSNQHKAGYIKNLTQHKPSAEVKKRFLL
jgi:hypothetical protein